MGNRFRLRISKIIPATCGSKGHSRNNARSSTLDPTGLPKPKPRRPSSLRRHVSRALKSCVMTTALSSDDERDRTESAPKTGRLYQWEEEEKYWQVVEITETPRRKVYASSAESTTKRRAGQRRRCGSTRRLGFGLGPVRVSASSAESGLFTNDETETLVSSSRSFSTEYSSSPHRRDKKKKEEKESEETPAARRRMIRCGAVEGKVLRESFAVVKRSDDPYEDFKGSMMEMILEKQMFQDDDLQQLLHCFLSLNSNSHHRLIVRAFLDIWDSLFSATVSSSPRLSRAL